MMTPPSVGQSECRSGSENSPHLPVSSSMPSEDLWREGSPTCSGCGNRIYDEMIQRVNGKLWHSACLRCTSCHQPLRQFCFAHGEELYCEDDFNMYFGFKCAACNISMSPTEVVHKLQNNVYHQTCFSCVCCQMVLQTGDKIYLRDDNKLLCEVDYQRLKEQSSKRSSCGFDSDSDCSTGSGKRLRTNISLHQTSILVKAYQHDDKPSRQALRQLSMETGLDTRVVRVWFQNRRAKDKRAAPSNDITGEQGHEIIAPSNMDDDSCGSFTGSETFCYRKEPAEKNTLQSSQQVYHNRTSCEYQTTTTPSCGRIGHWINFLDALSPESVPPNIELKASDIRNGEVCLENKLDYNMSSNTARCHYQNTDNYAHVTSSWLPSL